MPVSGVARRIMARQPESNTGLYRPFYRNGPDFRGGADVSFADVQQRYDFYSVRVGRWVTRQEQQRAANLFYDALRDLEEMLGVPPQVLSLQGSLGLNYAIGGQRFSCAHYEPATRVLALAKHAGGGSLAHEWFHGFDHYIASHLFPQTHRANAVQFASAMWLRHTPSLHHPMNQWLNQAFTALFASPTEAGPSEFMRHCMAYDAKAGRRYFGLPEELSARAFEHMLQSLPRTNHFLVSGTQQSAVAQAGLYPPPCVSRAFGDAMLSYFNYLGIAMQRRGTQ